MNDEKRYKIEILLIICVLILMFFINLGISLTFFIISFLCLLSCIIMYKIILSWKLNISNKRYRNLLLIILTFALFINIPIYLRNWKRVDLECTYLKNISTVFIPSTLLNSEYTLKLSIDGNADISSYNSLYSSDMKEKTSGEYIIEDLKVKIYSEQGSVYVFDVLPLCLMYNIEESNILYPDIIIKGETLFYENILSKLKHKIYNVDILN